MEDVAEANAVTVDAVTVDCMTEDAVITGQEESTAEVRKPARTWMVVSALLAVAGVVLFLLTQDLRGAMVWVDVWTLAHAVLAAGAVVVAALVRRRENNADDNDSNASTTTDRASLAAPQLAAPRFT